MPHVRVDDGAGVTAADTGQHTELPVCAWQTCAVAGQRQQPCPLENNGERGNLGIGGSEGDPGGIGGDHRVTAMTLGHASTTRTVGGDRLQRLQASIFV